MPRPWRGCVEGYDLHRLDHRRRLAALPVGCHCPGALPDLGLDRDDPANVHRLDDPESILKGTHLAQLSRTIIAFPYSSPGNFCSECDIL